MLQREYDILFDRVPCYVVVLDQDMTVVRNNELFRRTFGESIGKKCHEVFQQQGNICDNCPAKKTFSDGKVYRSNKRGRDKSGRTIYYHVTTAPLGRGEDKPSYVIEMALDTTHLHVLQEQLKENFDFQQSLIDSAIDSIVAVDENNKISIFNPSAEKLFGCRAHEVLGKETFERFVPAEFIDCVEKPDGKCVSEETVIDDSDGKPIPVRFSGTALTSGERCIGRAAVFPGSA